MVQSLSSSSTPTELTPLILVSSSLHNDVVPILNNESGTVATTRSVEVRDGCLIEQSSPASVSASTTTLQIKENDCRGDDEEESFHLARKLVHMWKQQTNSIRSLGSISIMVNSLTGPAMLSLPATFHKSGWIPTVTTIICVCVVSSFCSLHMANSISLVPGNRLFQEKIEFSDVFQTFWGDQWFVICQILFFCCMTCLNISSIVDTSQVMDTFLGYWYRYSGGSMAIQFVLSSFLDSEDDKQSSSSLSLLSSSSSKLSVQAVSVHWLRWDCSGCTITTADMDNGCCLPFRGEDGILLTEGYLITIILFLPLALLDLKENTAWQIIGFFVLLLTSLHFVVCFIFTGIDTSVISLWGTSWDTLLGVILFNFALVVVVPGWLHEKDPSIHVPTIIHSSSILSAFFYILIGALGVMAMPNVTENMLESMISGEYGVSLQLSASIFAFFIIGLGIPLYSVLLRYSLLATTRKTMTDTSYTTRATSAAATPLVSLQSSSDKTRRMIANIFAVYLPYLFSWLFYQGEAVTELLAWGGMICTSVVCFILPLLLSLYVMTTYSGNSQKRNSSNKPSCNDFETDDERMIFVDEEEEAEGSVPVQYCFGDSFKQQSRRSQIVSLWILIVVMFLCIFAAIIQNLTAPCP